MNVDDDIELIVRIVLRVLQEVRGQQPTTTRPPKEAERDRTPPGRQPLRLVTERDVLEAVPAGELHLAAGAVVTPLAREAAEAKGVRLVGG